MGNKNLTPDADYLIRDHIYFKTYETEQFGNLSIYKKNKSEFDTKIVKHFSYFSSEKQNDPKISKVQSMAKEIGKYGYFYDCQWINEENFIRGIFNGGTLPVSDLIGQWSEIEGLNLLNFLCKAGAMLEEKGLPFPDVSPDNVFITPSGPKINHPSLSKGFNRKIAQVNFCC